MGRRSWVLRRVGYAAFVFGLIGYGGAPSFAQTAAPAKQPAAGKQSAGTSSGAQPDPAAEAMAIAWFGNEIERIAIEKLLAAPKPDDLLPQIVKILSEVRTSLGKLESAAQCRWACPPGECSPDCHPRPIRTDPASRPVPFDRIMAILHWERSAIENTAIEVLGHNSKAYASVRQELDKALTGIRQMK